MALNDNAVLTAARGYIFTADVGTESPTATELTAWSPGSDLAGWDIVGHTSRDELPEFGFDGGDTETRGTWQVASLKTVQTDAITDYVTFTLVQFDSAAMELYYGQDNASTEAGRFRVAEQSTTGIERALLIVIVDGAHKVGFWAPNTDIRREEAIGMAVDDFTTVPLRATFHQYTDEDDGLILYDWIDEENLNPGS